MEIIAKYFNVSLLTSKHFNKKLNFESNTYYFSVESKDKLTKVIEYFDKYPLMGIKFLDYKIFKIIFTMILNKDHLTNLGRYLIKQYIIIKKNSILNNPNFNK